MRERVDAVDRRERIGAGAVEQRGRDLHRVGGADHHQPRRRAPARAPAASSAISEPMLWPTSARGRHAGAHRAGRAASRRATRSLASGAPALRPWPGRSGASTAKPWCANQRAASVQTLWSCSAPCRKTTAGQRRIERLAAGVGVGLLRAPLGVRATVELHRRRRALLRLERALEVVDQVVGIFEADREADRARADAGPRERRVVHAEVGGRGRMDHERAAVADVGEVREDLQRLDERAALRARARAGRS